MIWIFHFTKNDHYTPGAGAKFHQLSFHKWPTTRLKRSHHSNVPTPFLPKKTKKHWSKMDGCDVFLLFFCCSQSLTTKWYLCVCLFFCYDTWDWLIYWTVDIWYFLDLCIHKHKYVCVYIYIKDIQLGMQHPFQERNSRSVTWSGSSPIYSYKSHQWHPNNNLQWPTHSMYIYKYK